MTLPIMQNKDLTQRLWLITVETRGTSRSGTESERRKAFERVDG